ncbi:MAG: small ribosomal subunit Rsm22 family protein [Dehalococcoidia bacterium]
MRRLISLPKALSDAIRAETSRLPKGQLIRASSRLSLRYRHSGDARRGLQTEAERLAYIAARMPATYASVCAALLELRASCPELRVKSVLDLGGGSGSAIWAASAVWDGIEVSTVVDADENFLQMGRRLATGSDVPSVRDATWIRRNITEASTIPPHDLVVMSYSLGEIERGYASSVLDAAWQATLKTCVIVEPGSQLGFRTMLDARAFFMEHGGTIVAPCPGNVPCPLAALGDWCHFPQRLHRNELHKQAKDATLPFEDEKYSYTVATKGNHGFVSSGRIVRSPVKLPRHILLSICAQDGLNKVDVTKSQGDAYREARKLLWGDAFAAP